MSDKTIPAFSGLLSTMSVMKDLALGGTVPGRDDVLREEWDDIVVDTCVAFDTGAWETGIKRGSDSFAEQYEDRHGAVVGHARWVAAMKEDPMRELPDLMFWD